MTSADIVRELHTTRPVAPEALRARVQTIATAQQARPTTTRRRLFVRRRLLVALPAAAAVALASAGAIGIVQSDAPRPTVAAEAEELRSSAPPQNTTAAGSVVGSGSAQKAAPATGAVPLPGVAADAATTPGPTTGRAQRVTASLTIQVPDTDALSKATQRALDAARSLGGYVVSVSYATSEEGNASLTLRVPTAQVQDAITRLSGLGTILAQQVQIDDLQESIDALTKRIVTLRERIARISAQLTDTSLDAETRATLEARRRAARDELAALITNRAAQNAEARFATIQLGLVTEQGSTAVPGTPSRIDRAIDRAVEVLAWEGIAVLFALVVAGPFVLLGAGLWGVQRIVRRRENDRLLGVS
jgi:uncharacterized protein DUF4349